MAQTTHSMKATSQLLIRIGNLTLKFDHLFGPLDRDHAMREIADCVALTLCPSSMALQKAA
jgi:hypothetical protein